jgi:ketopantoate reductase
MTRIAILGAGAIGSMLGACLSRAGQAVTLTGRFPRHHQPELSMDGRNRGLYAAAHRNPIR